MYALLKDVIRKQEKKAIKKKSSYDKINIKIQSFHTDS